jgi:hypothetical protein
MSVSLYSFRPSALRISPKYRVNGLPTLEITRIGPPGPEVPATVVNDQVTFDPMVFPNVSLTPPLPPTTVAVYVVENARGELGTNVAVEVLLLYVTLADTTLLDESTSWNVLLLIVVASIASLKVAVTLVMVLTPLAPLIGLTEVTEGEVPLPDKLVTKTTSTQ